jgi:hypothetical protein
LEKMARKGSAFRTRKYRHSDLGRIVPSGRPNMSFGKDRWDKLRTTPTFGCVQQASDRETRDELGQFIDERLVDGNAERLLRK